MKTAIGMICIGISIGLFWVAFHDIESYLDPSTDTTARPTVLDVFNLVKKNTVG